MSSDGPAYLKRLLASGQHNDVNQMIRDQGVVVGRFGPVFRNAGDLDEGTFSEFLQFEHNRHWWNLHRHEEQLTRHFEVVRATLVDLLDDSRPIGDRIDSIGDLPGFTSDLYTAILLVTDPDTYGVRSQISDSAMQRLGLWPEMADDASDGEVYEAVNEMLHLVADELDTDLWTLDALWWGVEKEHDPTKHFVVRKRASTPTPQRRAPSKPSARPKKKTEPETFVCRNCFATKPLRLSSDTPGLCVDCA
jgi:hypothetical protein